MGLNWVQGLDLNQRPSGYELSIRFSKQSGLRSFSQKGVMESLSLGKRRFLAQPPKFQAVVCVLNFMGLEIRRGKSKWWYGRVMLNGRQLFLNLGVEIKGTPPMSLKQSGDAAFERSRERAQVALETVQNDYRRKSASIEIVQKLHELRTGYRISALPLEKIAESWKALPRRRVPSERYVAQVESTIAGFLKFVLARSPTIKDMSAIQNAHARSYLAAEVERGVSAKTYNNTLGILRSVFHALRKESGSPENPFDGFPTKEEETVFRKPFTTEELAKILKEAKSDPFIYPIIVTGACTAMRRGDCCLLRWDAVDFKNQFLAVKTSKTGESVRIPIFPLLEEVLKVASESKTDSPYVFPEQATLYRANPDGITWRVKQVLRKVGFTDRSNNALRRGRARIVKDEGPTTPESDMHVQRKDGMRRISVRDFHSFRVTWVTLALSAGVPMELVQKVTGHKTAHIVVKHYFQPGQEEFRKILSHKLPTLLGGGPVKEKALSSSEMLQKLQTMTMDNWLKVRDELVTTISGNMAN